MASEVHLASIYSALCTLLSLRDSLKVVNRSGILSTVKSLQQEDGSFKPYVGSLERDMRFTYCAIAIAYILGGLSTLNLDAARAFIMASKSYDGAFGQEPGCESHGGFTYCAIASLVLMDGTGFDPGRHRDTLDWCIRQHRPLSGFSGRLGKPADTCYSFWIGATIEMLGGLELVDHGVILDFLSAAAHERGGFGKMVGDPPDLLHTYFSLVAMGIMRRYHDLPVSGIYGPLGISAESFEHLKSLSVSSPSQPS